jgi:hypothetical protein
MNLVERKNIENAINAASAQVIHKWKVWTLL